MYNYFIYYIWCTYYAKKKKQNAYIIIKILMFPSFYVCVINSSVLH